MKISFYPILLAVNLHLLIHGFAEGRTNGNEELPMHDHTVKTIKSKDGDVIDCIDIYKQPTLQHPLLKNHTIQMKPSILMEQMKGDESEFKIKQTWNEAGKCPDGTVPILRTRKAVGFPTRRHMQSADRNFNFQNEQQEIAFAISDRGTYYGVSAHLNTWNPKVENDNEFTNAQISVQGSPQSSTNKFEIIEFGWTVYPKLFYDNQSRLFAYYTLNGYETGSYNYMGNGFVQVDKTVYLGSSLHPVSQINGQQFALDFYLYRDPAFNNWWLQIRDKRIGYFPGSLFNNLKKSADVVYWGGKVLNTRGAGHHTTTQMGSGRSPAEGFQRASYFRNLKIVDGSYQFRQPNKIYPLANKNNCYDIQLYNGRSDWGKAFFYGGSGLSATCS